MLNPIDWQQVVHDPGFWSLRYNGRFPGVTDEEGLAYFYAFYHLTEDEDELTEEEAEQVGWCRLSLSFPEDYTWQMTFNTEDGHAEGFYHEIFHPSIYPEGITIAVESGHERLPGLRWAELKHIERILSRHWQGDFDVRAIVPLLYPVVVVITFADLQEVRQSLASAWQGIGVLDASNTEYWLDDIIKVYDQEHEWTYTSHKAWEQLGPSVVALGEELWTYTEGYGWHTHKYMSTRYDPEEAGQFLPFFSMLERY